MWHSTERMAHKLYQLIDQQEIPVVLHNLQNTHISDIVTEILDSKFLLLGTPILNSHMLPTVAALMMYLKGLRPQKRFSFTFGSYGWATAGYTELEESLAQAGFEKLSEGTYIQFVPDESEINELNSVVEHIKQKFS